MFDGGAVDAYLEFVSSCGIDALYMPAKGPGKTAKPGSGAARQGAGAEGAESLDALEKEAVGCAACGLSATRNKVVFGAGNAHARLMLVGEAPGRDEDMQGAPFVGAAGKLLTNILKAIDLEREDVYIANVLKCRPPENRNPQPDEIIACRPILFSQIRLIKPDVILALGTFAAQVLLNTESSIGALRGAVHEFGPDGISLVATYHPAYLLRNPGAKRQVWEDVKRVRGLLDEKQT